MHCKNTTTAFQYFISIFLCSIFSVFGFFNNISSNSIIEVAINAIAGALLFILICLPTYFVYKNSVKNPIEIISEISVPLSIVVKFFYLITFFVFTCSILSQYIKFFRAQINREASIFFIILAFIIICSFGCLKGSQALFRTGTIILVFCFIALMFLIFGVIDKINFENMNFELSMSNQIADCINIITITLLPLTTFAIFSDSITGNLKKGIIISGISAFAVYLVFSILVTFVLGDYSNILIYPVFILSKISNIFMIKGGDGLLFALITAVTFLIIYLFFTSSAKVMNSSNSKLFSVGFAFSVLIFGTFINYFVKMYDFLTDTLFLLTIAIIALVVIPTFSYVIIKIRGKQ